MCIGIIDNYFEYALSTFSSKNRVLSIIADTVVVWAELQILLKWNAANIVGGQIEHWMISFSETNKVMFLLTFIKKKSKCKSDILIIVTTFQFWRCYNAFCYFCYISILKCILYTNGKWTILMLEFFSLLLIFAKGVFSCHSF